MEDKMGTKLKILEYTLIDCDTDLIYGPYACFEEARECAEQFKRWEIINRDGGLVDWSRKPKTGGSTSAEAA